MNKKNKYLFVRELFVHMGNHSGYDLLFKKLEVNPALNATSMWIRKDSFLWKAIRKVFKTIFKCELAEFLYWRKALKSDIVHVGYIEYNYNLFQKLKSDKRFKGQVIATVHQPPSWWKSKGCDPSIVSTLDKLIVMSESQISLFSEFLDANKIHFIPHAVDSDFFKPDFKKRVEFRVVFSGVWMRNIDVLLNVVDMVMSINPQVHFDIIYPHEFGNGHEVFGLLRHDNVNILKGLSDEELLDVYQSSSVMLLPLFDCTANNAILEGMSCGLPIISTDVDGIHSYVDDSFASLFHNYEWEKMAKKILEYSKDSELKNNHSDLARKHVIKKLTWDDSCDRVLDLYKSI